VKIKAFECTMWKNTINELVEILSHVIIQTYTFVALYVEKSLENSFR